MSGLSPIAHCTLRCGLTQAGQRLMIFEWLLSTSWDEQSDSSYTSWHSVQQPVQKHLHALQAWPRLTCPQVFLQVSVGCGGQL